MERHLDAMRTTASELYELDQKDEYTEFEEYNKYHCCIVESKQGRRLFVHYVQHFPEREKK